MTISQENVDELRSMSGLRLTMLRNAHNTLNIMSVLWLVVAGYMVYFRVHDKPDPRHVGYHFDAVYYLTIGFFVAACIVVATRSKAGWLTLMLLGLWNLQFFPFGAIVTAGCWYCGIVGVKLFGPNRLTAKQIQCEFDHRVDRYGYE